jgi:hypothetical protein
LWELAKYVIYHNENITMPSWRLLSDRAKTFEEWEISFGAKPSDAAFDPSKANSAKRPKCAFPVLVDIAESVTFVNKTRHIKGQDSLHLFRFRSSPILCKG